MPLEEQYEAPRNIYPWLKKVDDFLPVSDFVTHGGTVLPAAKLESGHALESTPEPSNIAGHFGRSAEPSGGSLAWLPNLWLHGDAIPKCHHCDQLHRAAKMP